jgi:glutaredoxin
LNKTVIYTRDGCTRCKHTIRLATALGMEPVVINTTSVPSAGDFLIDLGYTELPVVMIYPVDRPEDDGRVVVVEALDAWSGNRPSKLKEWA